MKTLITILIMFVVAGCSKSLTEEERLVGSYEAKDGDTFKYVFLKNGKSEHWVNDVKGGEGTWKFEAKEVHVILPNITFVSNITHVYKIDTNGNLKMIARIVDGKRKDFLKDQQKTLKKAK